MTLANSARLLWPHCLLSVDLGASGGLQLGNLAAEVLIPVLTRAYPKIAMAHPQLILQPIFAGINLNKTRVN